MQRVQRPQWIVMLPLISKASAAPKQKLWIVNAARSLPCLHVQIQLGIFEQLLYFCFWKLSDLFGHCQSSFWSPHPSVKPLLPACSNTIGHFWAASFLSFKTYFQLGLLFDGGTDSRRQRDNFKVSAQGHPRQPSIHPSCRSVSTNSVALLFSLDTQGQTVQIFGTFCPPLLGKNRLWQNQTLLYPNLCIHKSSSIFLKAIRKTLDVSVSAKPLHFITVWLINRCKR